jgi:hypothetical protein
MEILYKWKKLALCILLASTTTLTACDDNKSTQTATSENATQKQDRDKEQHEIAKYNAYIDVANAVFVTDGFSGDFEKQMQFINDNIENKKPLKNYFAVSDSNIQGKKKGLERALKMEGNLAELDVAAEKYLQALKVLEPLNKELSMYGSTNEYLSDGGKLFMEKEPALFEQLRKVLLAESEFELQIQILDEKNIKRTFDSAKKESLEYYKIGVIYYGKLISREVKETISQTDNTGLAKLDENINSMNALVKGYDKTKTVTGGTCLSSMTLFLASARTISNELKHDRTEYTTVPPVAFPGMASMQGGSPAQREANAMNDNLSSVIDSFNTDGC